MRATARSAEQAVGHPATPRDAAQTGYPQVVRDQEHRGGVAEHEIGVIRHLGEERSRALGREDTARVGMDALAARTRRARGPNRQCGRGGAQADLGRRRWRR